MIPSCSTPDFLLFQCAEIKLWGCCFCTSVVTCYSSGVSVVFVTQLKCFQLYYSEFYLGCSPVLVELNVVGAKWVGTLLYGTILVKADGFVLRGTVIP